MEFGGKKYEKYMKDRGIGIWRALNPTKSSLSERYLQTWRRRLEKYFYHNKTKKWIDVASKFADLMNKSTNAAHGFRPIDVAQDRQLQRKAYVKMFGSKIGGYVDESPASAGDSYRIANLKDVFTKGYRQSFSNEKYVLSKVINRGGKSLFKFKDSEGNQLARDFYPIEAKKVGK